MADGEQQTVSSYTPPDPGTGTSPLEADRAAAAAHDDAGRPEVAVAGAFVGAFMFAKLLKRFGGGD